jgi:hypothetical protein
MFTRKVIVPTRYNGKASAIDGRDYRLTLDVRVLASDDCHGV